MSIYCGNNLVSKIYAGNTEITKTYSGGSVVFGGSTPPESDPLIYHSFYSCAIYGAGPPTNDYTISGLGTSASPFVISVGGEDDLDNRAWISVNKTGTLYYSVEASSEDDYDGGRLYLASISPTQHTSYVALGGATPANYTALGLWVDGVGLSTGTVSVTSGSYLVLLYTKDNSTSDGLDNVTASLYIV
jgi:hypothetical protein